MNKKKRRRLRAAIVPFHKNGSKVLMLFMRPSDEKYGGRNFQIAKGKLEEGETNEFAALREGREELGLLGENIINTYDLGTFLGYTQLFVVEISDPDKFIDPHFETKETRWMSTREFMISGRDIHKPVVKAVDQFLQSK